MLLCYDLTEPFLSKDLSSSQREYVLLLDKAAVCRQIAIIREAPDAIVEYTPQAAVGRDSLKEFFGFVK